MAEIEINILLLSIMGTSISFASPLKLSESVQGMKRIFPYFFPVLVGLAACQPTGQKQPLSVGMLMFGDSGYHLDYPDQDDYDDLFTEEGFVEDEWLDWVEDKRPMDEFEARPTSISPVTGKTVPATGMHAISAAMKHFCRNVATCDFGVMLGDNIYPSGANTRRGWLRRRRPFPAHVYGAIRQYRR